VLHAFLAEPSFYQTAAKINPLIIFTTKKMMDTNFSLNAISLTQSVIYR